LGAALSRKLSWLASRLAISLSIVFVCASGFPAFAQSTPTLWEPQSFLAGDGWTSGSLDRGREVSNVFPYSRRKWDEVPVPAPGVCTREYFPIEQATCVRFSRAAVSDGSIGGMQFSVANDCPFGIRVRRDRYEQVPLGTQIFKVSKISDYFPGVQGVFRDAWGYTSRIESVGVAKCGNLQRSNRIQFRPGIYQGQACSHPYGRTCSDWTWEFKPNGRFRNEHAAGADFSEGSWTQAGQYLHIRFDNGLRFSFTVYDDGRLSGQMTNGTRISRWRLARQQSQP
jgi:hypothetical protein